MPCEFYFPCFGVGGGGVGVASGGCGGSKSNSFEIDFHSGTVGYNFIKMIEICACMLVMSEMGRRVIDIRKLSCRLPDRNLSYFYGIFLKVIGSSSVYTGE